MRYIEISAAAIVAFSISLSACAKTESEAAACQAFAKHINTIYVLDGISASATQTKIDYEVNKRMSMYGTQKLLNDCAQQQWISKNRDAVKCITAAKTLPEVDACDAKYPTMRH